MTHNYTVHSQLVLNLSCLRQKTLWYCDTYGVCVLSAILAINLVVTLVCVKTKHLI